MLLACRALNSGHARRMRSGKAEGLLTWPPRMMNGLPSTCNWYTPLAVFEICAIGLFCATASGRTAASTNSPLRVIIGSRVAGGAGDPVAGDSAACGWGYTVQEPGVHARNSGLMAT